MRAGREADRLVTGCEVDIKPCDKRMHKVIATAGQLKVRIEGEISSRAFVEIEAQDGRWVCHGSLDLNCVNQGFG